MHTVNPATTNRTLLTFIDFYHVTIQTPAIQTACTSRFAAP